MHPKILLCFGGILLCMNFGSEVSLQSVEAEKIDLAPSLPCKYSEETTSPSASASASASTSSQVYTSLNRSSYNNSSASFLLPSSSTYEVMLYTDLQVQDDDDIADDDRHVKDPDDYNSTNGPAGIITRMPSSFPSSLPSQFPSASPSISNAPSIIQPCSSYNPFNFGITHEKDGYEVNFTESLIRFNYDLETDVDVANFMGESFIDLVKAVEISLLNLLTRIYFPQCNDSDDGDDYYDYRSTNSTSYIFRSSMLTKTGTYNDAISNNDNQNSTRKLIGMSSKPFDVANGEQCKIISEGNPYTIKDHCHMMDGLFTLYYYSSIQTIYHQQQGEKQDIEGTHIGSKPANLTLRSGGRRRRRRSTNNQNDEASVMQSIKYIMDDGKLDTCHPAVISVRFRNTMKELENEFDTGDDGEFEEDGSNIVPLEIMSATSWILLGTSMLVMVMLVFTRYKHYLTAKHHEQDKKDDRSNSTSGGVFLELDRSSDNRFDMVSSLTMARSESLSGSNSGSSSPSSSVLHNRSIIRSSPCSSKSSKKCNARNTTDLLVVKGCEEETVEISNKLHRSRDHDEESNKSYLDSIQSETGRIKAKIAKVRKTIDEAGKQQKSVRHHLKNANETPSSETLPMARLALNEPDK